MAFTNPIQTSTSAGAAGTVVPSSSSANLEAAGSLIQGAAKVASLLFQPQDTSNEVKNLVNTRLEEYSRVKEEKGAAAAERFLGRKFQEDLSGLGSAAKEVYKDSFKSSFGDSPIKTERDRELALIEQQAKEELEERDTFIDKGRQIVLSLGMNPDEVGEDRLVRYGEQRAAQEQALDFQSKQIAVQQQRFSLGEQQFNADQVRTKRNTELAGSAILMDLSSKIDVGLSELSQAVQNDPAKAESLKTEYISRLAFQQARAATEIKKAVQEAGGDPSLLPPSVITSYENELKAARDYLNSEHIKTRLQANEDIAKLDAMATLRKNDPVAYNIVTLVPQASSTFASLIQSGLTSGAAQDSTNATVQVLADMTTGPATARSKLGSDTPVPYRIIGEAMDTASKMGEDVRQEYVTRGAEMVSTALMESISPSKKIRSQANSNTGMHEAIKIMKNKDFSPEDISAIRSAVQEDGMELETVMQERMRTFIGESLLPSLRPPAVSGVDDVPYKAELRNGVLRLEPVGNTERSSSEFESISNAVGNRAYRDRLKKMERVLNDEIQVYTKLTGGSAEELARVIEAALGIERQVQEISEQPQAEQE